MRIKPYLQRIASQSFPEFGALQTKRSLHYAVRRRSDGLYEGIEFAIQSFELKTGFFVSFFPDVDPVSYVFSIQSSPTHLKHDTAWIPARSDVYSYGSDPNSVESNLAPLIIDLRLVRPALDAFAAELLSDPLLPYAMTFLDAPLPSDAETARVHIRDALISRGSELRLPVSQTRRISGISKEIMKHRKNAANVA